MYTDMAIDMNFQNLMEIYMEIDMDFQKFGCQILEIGKKCNLIPPLNFGLCLLHSAIRGSDISLNSLSYVLD
jgi:hypothetical protein